MKMQIIHPGQHPMIGGIIILFLVAIGIVGLALIIYGLRLLFRKSNKNIIKYGAIVLGVIILSFPLYNWVNYNLIYQSQQDQFIGEYRNKEYEYYIDLNDDGTWQSNHNEFEGKSGTWEFIMTEDMNYIELIYEESEYSFLQIYSYDESYIEFSSDQNRGGTKMQLRFEKTKN